MTQDLKDKALDLLARCTVDGKKVRLPEEEIDTEVWTVVKDAMKEASAQFNKRSKVFVCENDPTEALTEAKAWLQSQEVVTYDAPVLYDGPETIEPEDLGNDEEKKEDLQFKKEKRTLRYDFTAQETHELALKLAEANRRLATVEEEQSSISAQYGARKKMIKAELNEYSLLITNGYEHRDVECEIHYNKPVPGKKTILRLDTNTSSVEKMEPWEFNLFTQPADDSFEEELAR